MIKKGLIWDFGGKLFNQGVTFFVSIILTRKLEPEDFGLIAMVMVVTGIAGVFVDFGLGSAIIQSKEVNNKQFNTVFWLNNLLATVVALIVILIAPFVANYYEQPDLVLITRVLSVTFIMNALGGVHAAMLTREMNFKYLSQLNIFAAMASGLVGIYGAYAGYGVWALVLQILSNSVVRQLALWKGTKWWPQLEFSWPSVKPMWNFSQKLFLSGLIDTIYRRLDYFVIGRMFVPATLGYYQRAKALDQLIITYSSMSLRSVLFPALSKIQDDIQKVKEKVVDFFHLAAMASFFLAGFLYLISEDLLILMYTDRWVATIPYFRVMVFASFAYPVSAILLTPITSLGRSDIFLKLEIIKKVLMTLTYIIGFSFGLMEFLYAYLILMVVSVAINGYYSGKLIHWKIDEQFKILITYAIFAFIGAYLLFTYFTLDMAGGYLSHLIINSIVYTAYFIGLNYLFKTKALDIAIRVIQPYWNKISKRTN